MRATVAICTWNRARLLDQTLAEMRKLRIPPGIEWELVIVNNNCTDDTDAVVARYQDALPIRRVFEPKQGHSNSRNCAIEAARGELLIWTDDDVLVDPEWIAAYAEAAARWPNAGYFGGLIEPWYECQPASWTLENLKQLEGMLVIRDLGREERNFAGKEKPFGANMAFRADILRGHRFNPGLGRTGDDGVVGDETVLIDGLNSAGIRGVWVPSARVKHFVAKRRLTRRYLWEYYRGYGRTIFRQESLRQVPRVGKTWWGVPRWLIRQTVEYWVLAQCRRLWSRTDWVSTYIKAAIAAGMMVEYRLVGTQVRPTG